MKNFHWSNQLNQSGKSEGIILGLKQNFSRISVFSHILFIHLVSRGELMYAIKLLLSLRQLINERRINMIARL